MKMFLRYNSRHCLWFPRGYKDKWFPQFNPIESSSHGKDGRHTRYMHEPLWAMKLRHRLFAFAGRQYCGRRGESWQGATDVALPDTWDIGPDGNRTCSYCGSIHFDDLMEICKKALLDERYSVDGTDKQYKVYVRQPGVMNASQGAIKYYKAHTPKTVTQEQNDLFKKAYDLSHARFMTKFNRKEI